MAFQRSSARVSAGCSTRPRGSRGSSGRGEHSTIPTHAQRVQESLLWMKNRVICRVFPSSTRLSTGVEDERAVARTENADLPGAAVSDLPSGRATVENLPPKRSVYTRRSLQAQRAETT